MQERQWEGSRGRGRTLALAACPETKTWKTRPPEPDLAGVCDRALLLVGFWTALCRSEVAALTVGQVNPTTAASFSSSRGRIQSARRAGRTGRATYANRRTRCPVTALRTCSTPPTSPRARCSERSAMARRRRRGPGTGRDGLIPLLGQRDPRLLAALALTPVACASSPITWSNWRRRKQHQARTCRYRCRGQHSPP
jgi:hypothetical protein